MVKGVLIFLFFFGSGLFAASDISDYFGVWKGEAHSNGKKYSVYVSFPGLGDSKAGYYKAGEEKKPERGYHGYFQVTRLKKDLFKAKIRTQTGAFNTISFPVDASMEQGRIFVKSFLATGEISLPDENIMLFDFKNDFGGVSGRLERISSADKSSKSSKKKTSGKKRVPETEKIKPVLIEKR